MKKIFAILLVVMLIASMTVTTHAATPKLDIPDIEIPDISGSVKVELPDNFWGDYFKANPFNIDFSKIKLRGWN